MISGLLTISFRGGTELLTDQNSESLIRPRARSEMFLKPPLNKMDSHINALLVA